MKCDLPMEVYREFYNRINGGIDGYYERTILEADCYEVTDDSVVAYFTVHEERGLTSLVVLPDYKEQYKDIFDFVLNSGLFNKVLFTENDLEFKGEIDKRYISEVQAYNFSVDRSVKSSVKMTKTSQYDLEKIYEKFGDFISYNNMNLNDIDSFLLEEYDLISFGALEPLVLNPNRYCLSMIVNEDYRGKGFGSETVKYLMEYLQDSDKEVNARCYVLNDVSRKTLLRSGMYISNRLYKVEDLTRVK